MSGKSKAVYREAETRAIPDRRHSVDYWMVTVTVFFER
jgi:hypothetical protein